MFFRRAVVPTLVLALCTACSRQPAPVAAPRLAVVRFENLTGSASLDWAGRALSEVINSELSTASGVSIVPSAQLHSLDRQTGPRPANAPGISAERSLAILSGATRIAYGTYSIQGGKLHATLALEDVAVNRTLRVYTAEAPPTGVLTAASTLARALAPSAGNYSTANPAALEAYIEGLESPSIDLIVAASSRAIAADPDFAPAYRMLAGARARQNDLSGALVVLASAARRGNSIPPAEQARDAMEAAALRNDPVARRRALADLVKAAPGDLEAWRVLGELSFGAREFPAAIESFHHVLAFQPDDANSLNQLAYAQAYAGDLPGALAILKRYQALRPDDANTLDSTGDAYLISGNLAEAANYYQRTYQKDPKFQNGGDLFKGAMTHLMMGDSAGADALYQQFAATRADAHDPAVDYRQAEWDWLAGRRQEAYRKLAHFAQTAETGPLRDFAARAYSELALWSLMLGDSAAASDMLRKAAPLAGPTSAATFVMARFLAQPAAPAADWEARAGLVFRGPNPPPVRDLWLACAYLLHKDFAAAGPALERWSATGTASNDESLPILQAWAALETGKLDRAAELLKANPVPPIAGPGLLTGLYFPRIFYLRARLAEQQGEHEEAKSNYQRFLQLSGSTPLAWGEEKKAGGFR